MKSIHRPLSTILLYCCVAGCQQTKPQVSPAAAAAYRLQILEQIPTRNGSTVGLELAQTIVGDITARLLHDSPKTTMLVDVVDSPEVLAFSYPGGIVVSTSLLSRLPNEAMCAFVLAHEISHHILGHINEASTAESTTEYSLAAEMAADRRAVAMMATAAYDVRLAVNAIATLSPILHDTTSDIAERRAAISEFIEQSKWRPPGTITRRTYQEMLAGLS